MGTALEDSAKLVAKPSGDALDEKPDLPGLEVAQERYDEAIEALRKAKKPLLKASEDLATFNSALAAAILAGQLTPEQKEDALEARVALAAPFGVRVSRFANVHRSFLAAGRVLAEAEKAWVEAGNDPE
jgi:hypothetical protein